jgi:hypothetical protein
MEGFGISDDGSDNKRLSRKKRAREWCLVAPSARIVTITSTAPQERYRAHRTAPFASRIYGGLWYFG